MKAMAAAHHFDLVTHWRIGAEGGRILAAANRDLHQAAVAILNG